jgi:hypothetical protein
MPYPKGRPHSEETKAKMRVAHAGRAGRPQTEAARQKLRAARTGKFLRHGMSKHPLYRTWRDMINRCENLADPAYRNYGGRGIAVCEAWHDVRVFVADIERQLGPRPDGMTLDRIDNEAGNYEPGKVRWATAQQQASNRRKHGHVGEATRGEIAYAQAHGKPVQWLEGGA